MHLSVHTNLESCRAAWRALEEESGATAFQTLDWAEAWIHGFCRTGAVEPRIVVGREAGAARLILPLAYDRWLGCGRLRWLGAPTADYSGALLAPSLRAGFTADRMRALLARAAREMGDIDFFWLERQPEESLFATLGARPHAWSAHALSLRATWKETYEALHSSATRSRLAGKERKLARLGDLRFERLLDPADAAVVTEILLAWKSRQLLSRGDRDPFDPVTIGVLEDVAARPRLARVYRLALDGRTIAACLCLTHAATLYIYQVAYDPEAAPQTSPGRLLLYKIFEAAAADGFSTIDFTIGDEDYKLALCDRSAPMMRYWHAVTPKGRLACAVLDGTTAARESAARHKRLRSLLLKANAVRQSVAGMLGGQGSRDVGLRPGGLDEGKELA